MECRLECPQRWDGHLSQFPLLESSTTQKNVFCLHQIVRLKHEYKEPVKSTCLEIALSRGLNESKQKKA